MDLGPEINDGVLLRQVHPNFVQDGRVTSQAFCPTKKDEGLLSVNQESMTTAPHGSIWNKATRQYFRRIIISTIASLNVAITADNASFNRGLAESARKTQEFSAEMLTSRSAVQTFAGITGEAAGPLQHLVHAFEVMPGPIGAAIGALYAAKEVYNGFAEQVKKSAEEQEHFTQTIIDLDAKAVMLGSFGKAYQDLSKTAVTEIKKIRDAHKDLENDIVIDFGGEQMADMAGAGMFETSDQRDQAREELAALDARNEKFKEHITILANVAQQMDDLKHAQKELGFNDAGPAEVMKNLREQASALRIAMRDLDRDTKGGRAAFDDLRNSLDTVRESMKHITDEQHKIAEHAAKERAKEEKKVNDEIEKQFHDSTEHMRRSAEALAETITTPLEKYQKQMEKILDLQGNLSDDAFNKLTQKADDDLLKSTDKEFGGTSSAFKQLDPSRISAAGLAMQNKGKQTVQDPEMLAAIKAMHETIKEQKPSGATVARG